MYMGTEIFGPPPRFRQNIPRGPKIGADSKAGKSVLFVANFCADIPGSFAETRGWSRCIRSCCGGQVIAC